MAEHSRYSVSDEESGIEGEILKNKPGIQIQTALDDAETHLFSDTYEHFFDLLSKGKLMFDLPLLFQIHKYFFAPLYFWAGKIRTVDISKNGMLFASVVHIDRSLKEFESLLKLHSPKEKDTRKKTAQNLAIIHCELNAIHPFREGNGRTIRLFLDLLAVKAGYSPIDWSRRTQKEYIRACVDGMAKKYSRMEKIVYAGLTRK